MGNDLKTFLLHRTAFLCVSRFLRLASFDTVNALMIAISVTFQPLFSVIPKIYRNFVYSQSSFAKYIVSEGFPRIMRNSIALPIIKVQYELILSNLEEFKQS